MVAPAPVSALLHAVAVVKAGVFTVLKIAIYVFGMDALATAGAAWLPWVASATILIASIVALTRGNLKARLAYSTVSQLSYIVLAAGLASSSALLGGAMHIAMHAVAKITLFFCAGAIAVAAHKTEVRELDGLGRRMPITLGAFGLASLAIIGLPPLGGSWSKWYLIVGALEADGVVFAGVLMLSSLLSVAYLMPIVGRAFFLPASPDPRSAPGTEHEAEDDGVGVREAPLLCVVPLCITALGCVALFFFAEELELLLAPIVGGGGGAAE
jgi:multicomponent Na+:H+ antiporter subunit D